MTDSEDASPRYQQRTTQAGRRNTGQSNRGGRSIAGSVAGDLPMYTPAYRGADTTVELRSDYLQEWRALQARDDDSLFGAASYNVPHDITRFWGTRSVTTGNREKILKGPVTHVTVGMGFATGFENNGVSFLSAPDNHQAACVAANAFAKDMMAAVRAVIDKYNGAIAEAAAETGAGQHTALETWATDKNLPGMKTWQQAEAALRSPIDHQDIAAHQRHNGCTPYVSWEHSAECPAYVSTAHGSSDSPGGAAADTRSVKSSRHRAGWQRRKSTSPQE